MILAPLPLKPTLVASTSPLPPNPQTPATHPQVVKVRAEAMAAAARTGSRPHGMLSIVGLKDEELEGLCREAAEQLPGGDTVCVIANRLFPTVRLRLRAVCLFLCLCLYFSASGNCTDQICIRPL